MSMGIHCYAPALHWLEFLPIQGSSRNQATPQSSYLPCVHSNKESLPGRKKCVHGTKIILCIASVSLSFLSSSFYRSSACRFKRSLSLTNAQSWSATTTRGNLLFKLHTGNNFALFQTGTGTRVLQTPVNETIRVSLMVGEVSGIRNNFCQRRRN